MKFTQNDQNACGPVNIDLKVGKPGLLGSGFDSEGQLKERSEGDQAQWQTALEEVMAAGS
jgi:hypothetical protein